MTQLQSLFRGLITDEAMPPTLTFIKNGVETTLLKMESPNGGIHYVGTPRYKNSRGQMRVSDHALVLTQDCRVEGTYALNSIIVGGWKHNSKDPGWEARNTLKDEIMSTLITAAVLIRQGTEIKDVPLISAIERESGFQVVKSPATPEQLAMMSAVNVRNHLAEILESKGWSLLIYPEDLVKRLRGYCKVEPGQWDAQADAIATTSALPYARVQVLKDLGYTLKKRFESGSFNKESVTS